MHGQLVRHSTVSQVDSRHSYKVMMMNKIIYPISIQYNFVCGLRDMVPMRLHSNTQMQAFILFWHFIVEHNFISIFYRCCCCSCYYCCCISIIELVKFYLRIFDMIRYDAMIFRKYVTVHLPSSNFIEHFFFDSLSFLFILFPLILFCSSISNIQFRPENVSVFYSVGFGYKRNDYSNFEQQCESSDRKRDSSGLRGFSFIVVSVFLSQSANCAYSSCPQ